VCGRARARGLPAERPAAASNDGRAALRRARRLTLQPAVELRLREAQGRRRTRGRFALAAGEHARSFERWPASRPPNGICRLGLIKLSKRIVRVLDMKSTDPIVELRRQARESSGWHSTQRVDLVRSQLNSELETGASRVPKEVSPEAGVRQQATERSFHVSLTHASSHEQGLHQVSSSLSTTCWCDYARECVNPHLNVEVRTIPETIRANTAGSAARSRWRTPCTGALRRTRS
jgi:hypothetical protein